MGHDAVLGLTNNADGDTLLIKISPAPGDHHRPRGIVLL
jgi:hypothetical protein